VAAFDRRVTSLGELVPPRDLLPEQHREGFIESGKEMLALLIRLGGLGPDDDVLDVGCGAGRIAVALSSYLSMDGSYEGFDVLGERIDWCTQNITPRHSNFRFQVADVYNERYNPRGTIRGADFRFPYPDERFDLVFLFSVFTHMLSADFENYLAEISRVLRPDGRCLATFLLLNEESLGLIEEDDRRKDPAKNALNARFGHDFGTYRISDPRYPEQVVAYREEFVDEACSRHGLRIRGRHYGWWPGRDRESRDRQDVVVADRIPYKSART
jgi:SAM-dependent methyltransferase